MKISYKWLQTYFDEALPSPEKIEELLSLHSFEIESVERRGDDSVFDVDVLPNRAHDCLSHRGIAKELSVVAKLSLKKREKKEIKDIGRSAIKVTVEDADICRRYSARLIRNLAVGPSPDWLKERLEAVGQRSVNAVVDAANYVMLDCGQPIHVFDAQKVSDQSIIARRAVAGEQITTLSGEVKDLTTEMLIIADSEKPLAIAGVKGGKGAEVVEQTTDIIIEVANFDPISVRKTSRAVGIQNDSSKRFENNISPESVPDAMADITNLICLLSATEKIEIYAAEDVYMHSQPEVAVSVSALDVSTLLGIAIETVDVKAILDRFAFMYTQKDDVFTVTVPHDRLDIRQTEDLIEEIGRVYGYQNTPSVTPVVGGVYKVDKQFYYSTKIRKALIGCGYSEVYAYSFVAEGGVEVKNPIASDKKFLRRTLAPKIRECLVQNSTNSELLGVDMVRVFEIGEVFVGEEEQVHVAVGAMRLGDKKEVWKEELKQVVSLLTEELGVTVEVKIEDGVAEVNLSAVFEALSTPATYDDLELTLSPQNSKYTPVSFFPVVLRDISVWVSSEADREQLEMLITKSAGDLLARAPRLVDTYAKDGRVSYAYRLVFQSSKKTLLDEEVNVVMKRVEQKIIESNWEVR